MKKIDGSLGEGGGQILRSALALSILSQEPFEIYNIRAGRKKGGLLRQHLTAVKAACAISNAQVDGARMGSQELCFRPGPAQAGKYHFAVGTAGSATLVLQTILPALASLSQESHVTVEGGTHNLAAPPYDFLEKAFLPVLRSMGVECKASIERYGFYPAGGGIVRLSIKGRPELLPLEILERGSLVSRKARSLVANLPVHIAEQELACFASKLNWRPEECFIEKPQSPGAGNIVLAELNYENISEVFTGFGSRNTSASRVAEQAINSVKRYTKAKAPIGEHLADQLLLPFAMAGGGAFRCSNITRHCATNMDIIEEFLPVKFQVEKNKDGSHLIKVQGEKE